MKFFKNKQTNTGPARNATYNVAGGFTLVETLVGISIFTGAIISMLSFAGGSIGDTNYSKNKLVATFLAQEGVEYIKNLRDTYVLFETDGWTLFRAQLSLCESGNGCYFNSAGVSYTSPSIQPMKDLSVLACAAECPILYYDNSGTITTTKYNYDTNGVPTNFIRKIQITNINNVANAIGENKEILVTSTVYWKKGNQVYNVSFSNYLKNWAE